MCNYKFKIGRHSGSRKRNTKGQFINSHQVKFKFEKKEKKKRRRKEEKKKEENKELSFIDSENIRIIMEVLKHGSSYKNINQSINFSARWYYRQLEQINIYFMIFLKGQILNIINKKYDNLVLGYDGRWSSRRSGRECTVSLIIIDGPEELKKQNFILIFNSIYK
ncbi:hypothetical protein M0812_16089 [Anaeramoeba flamelloides]|uniref:Uncharacterized protein n=1 Tax=Anaeramoeba flamelloides TaxID=1746091 RepID=A0AAV7ZDF6_9EUKA|nr:hypothetical protein M0812_16089 [Anaeramoeba flamelloides]